MDPTNKAECKTCIHYRRHYILDEQSCTPIDCGHCAYPRTKHREPDHPACVNFEPRTILPALPDRDSVPHFLTTELLRYILSLNLPPERNSAE